MKLTTSDSVWAATSQHAGEKAKALRPLALTLFIVALAMIGAKHLVGPVIGAIKGGGGFAWWQIINVALVDAAPALALSWGLLEMYRYLGRVEAGQVWAADSMIILARAGDCLWAAAVWLAVFGPTLHTWIKMDGRFDVQIDATVVALAGLGILLSATARMLGRVLAAAAAIKADSDAIV